MFKFCHNYGRPHTLVNGFRMPVGFRNLATSEFEKWRAIRSIVGGVLAWMPCFRGWRASVGYLAC